MVPTRELLTRPGRPTGGRTDAGASGTSPATRQVRGVSVATMLSGPVRPGYFDPGTTPVQPWERNRIDPHGPSCLRRYFGQVRNLSQFGGKKLWHVSQNLGLAVQTDPHNHILCMSRKQLSDSNKQLQKVGSGITLQKTDESARFCKPPRKAVVLHQVEPRNSRNATQGDDMQIYADCGRAAATVSGGSDRAAVYRIANKRKLTTADDPVLMRAEVMKKWLLHRKKIAGPKGADPSLVDCLVKGKQAEKKLRRLEAACATAEKAVADDPGNVMAERALRRAQAQYERQTERVAEAYFRYYNTLPARKRKKADRSLGINTFARPAVGGGFTMASGGAGFPGESTWNYHWGGVIARDGADTVTLENFSVSRPAVQNTLWTFTMYGMESGQTFHEQHYDTQQHGQSPTTMAYRKKP